MATLENPIDKDQLEQLKASRKDMQDALNAIDKATRAGIEIPGAREQAQANLDKINSIIQVYFPGQ